MRHLGSVILAVCVVVVVSSQNACGGAKDASSKGGATICPDNRQSLDCESEVAYQGVKTEGGLHVLNVGATGAFANTALRQINQDVEKYVAGQTHLCREYNACIVTGEQYHAEAEKARASLSPLTPLVAKINGTDPRERADAADQILTAVTKTASGPALAINVSLEIELPPTVGGGSIVAPQNYPIPTNARAAFKFGVTQTAYVYLFQVDAQHKVSVLFPDDRISTKNPLPPNADARIPEGSQRFRIDENGVGTENVYIVASSRALTSVEQSLRRFQSGQATDIGQDPLLAQFAGLQPGSPECARTRGMKLEEDGSSRAASSSPITGGGMECPKTRGIVLDEAPQPNQNVGKSLQARAAAGDDTIVKLFRFQHVTEPQYKTRLTEYNAPTAAGGKTRGIAIEN